MDFMDYVNETRAELIRCRMRPVELPKPRTTIVTAEMPAGKDVRYFDAIKDAAAWIAICRAKGFPVTYVRKAI